MGVDFSSEWFKSLPKWKKREIVKEEFKKCKNSFEYFVDNYAYLRHPSKGIIKAKLFDFQYDVAVPISIVLRKGRTKEAYEELANYKFRYDYEKHMKYLAENFLDTYKLVPAEFHDFYKHTFKHPDYRFYVDTIVLKSRQVGLSTVFQLLKCWHINFFPSVHDLVVSQDDTSAKKFIRDIQRTWELIPAPLRAQKLKMNDHELKLTLSSRDYESGVMGLPPTPRAGRSHSPNLVVLDEFAFWEKPEETYTAISMALSAGGVMVIISTPNGVGNLYHRLWEMSKKHFSVYVENKNSGERKIEFGILKPVVVHWTQLPIEEFKRRGFDDPVDWYKFMSNKIKLEKGERGVAQELDLDFITSGESLIPHDILKQLRNQSLEKTLPEIKQSRHLQGFTIYEEPKKDCLYLLGVDVSEGIGKDYSVVYVLKVGNQSGILTVPQVVAKYSSNNVSPTKFSEIVVSIANLYNKALINFEKNNPGLVLLSELVDKGKYDPTLIFNRYNPSNGKFVKGEKGWRTTKTTKSYMLSVMKSFLIENYESVNLPMSLLDEILTFYEESFHDDEVMAYSLALVGWNLLDKYRQFLLETNGTITAPIEDDEIFIASSTFDTPEVDEFEKEYGIVEISKKETKEQIDTTLLSVLESEIKSEKKENKDSKEEKQSSEIFKYRFLTRPEKEYEEDDNVFVF